MPRPVGLAMVLLLILVAGTLVAGDARADDAASIRQELESLRGKIEQLDAALTDSGSAELKQEADDYAAKVKANAAAAEALKQRTQRLTARAAELETEHAAAEKLCRKTTATTEEYEAALAQCEKARQTYQQHADAYRAEQQHLTTDYETYDAAAKQLQARYQDIEQKRQGILAKQASLHDERQQALGRFNELRDRLNGPPSIAK